MIHKMRIKRKYYDLLRSGLKTLEVRVGYKSIRKVKQGDTIVFENYSHIGFYVKRVTIYQSFADMLQAEEAGKIIPGASYSEALEALQHIYPLDKERMGVYVLELIPPLLFVHLSSIQDEARFNHCADELYTLTDWICGDYPKHREHYYEKYLPGIKDGTREIIGCYMGRKPIGIAILKNTPEEKKLSTLYVDPEYRGIHIASRLVDAAKDFLGTTRPVITIASYKVPQFAGLIAKYDWKHTDTLPRGYYNNDSEEWVFNS